MSADVYNSLTGAYTDVLSAEVVLAVMLRSFKFTPSDKEVYWNLAGVNYPTVGQAGSKAALYLKLEAVKS